MKILLIGLLAFAAGVIALFVHGNSVEEQREVENGGFRLRVSKLENNLPGIMPPSSYLIESNHGLEGWAVVKRWNQREPWPVSDIEIKVLNPSIAYYFNSIDFGVTVDAGRTWQSFAFAARFAMDKIEPLSGGASRAEIDSYGTGNIYLQDHANRFGNRTVIYTTEDFGQHWIRSGSE